MHSGCFIFSLGVIDPSPTYNLIRVSSVEGIVHPAAGDIHESKPA